MLPIAISMPLQRFPFRVLLPQNQGVQDSRPSSLGVANFQFLSRKLGMKSGDLRGFDVQGLREPSGGVRCGILAWSWMWHFGLELFNNCGTGGRGDELVDW